MNAAPERPQLGTRDAVELAERLFGVRVRADELPSYCDRNFRLTADDGASYVLKVTRADESAALLDAETRALIQLADAGIPVPVAHASLAAAEGKPCVSGNRPA